MTADLFAFPAPDCLPLGECENFRILQGDCIQHLRMFPDESIDCISADPPYSSGGAFRSDRTASSSNHKYLNHDNKRKYPEIQGDSRMSMAWFIWASLWLLECYRVAKPGAYIFIFADWRQVGNAQNALEMAGFTLRGLIPWDKGDGARLPNTDYFRHQCEYIAWGTKGPTPGIEHDRESYAGYFHSKIPQNKEHPTEKPVDLYDHILQVCPPEGVILDPFSGSGSSGQASIELGRRYIGIELSREYAEISHQRLIKATQPHKAAQMPLFEGI